MPEAVVTWSVRVDVSEEEADAIVDGNEEVQDKVESRAMDDIDMASREIVID